MLKEWGIINGHKVLDNEDIHGDAYLKICDLFLPNGLGDPLGIELLEL